MSFRVDERASDLREIDRFDGGVGWIAHPEETIQRASHALVVDDEVWVFDPVDAAALDDLLAELGPVAGVVVGVGRHTRDAAAIADRHGAHVYLPGFFEGVAEDLDAPIVRFGAELADTGLEVRTLWNNRFWQEVALFDPERGTLLVPESLGTAPYFLAGSERLGVHPMARPLPPREQLGGLRPERVLVGHGEGVLTDAASALEEALAGSRRRTPRLYAAALWRFLPL